MSVVKPLLWLLEPYIVYKAYLWALRFIAHPVTWEGEIDLFSLTLTMLLILDAVALPLVILYCPSLNPGKRLPNWIHRLGTPIYIAGNPATNKAQNGGYASRYNTSAGFMKIPESQISLSSELQQNEGWGADAEYNGWAN